MNPISKILYGGIGLTILFVLVSTVILPNFATTYNYCQNPAWKPDNSSSGVYTNCTDRVQDAYNSTPSPTDYPITVDTAEDYRNYTNLCLNCDTRGGFSTTLKGITVFILVIAMIAFGVWFWNKR